MQSLGHTCQPSESFPGNCQSLSLYSVYFNGGITKKVPLMSSSQYSLNTREFRLRAHLSMCFQVRWTRLKDLRSSSEAKKCSVIDQDLPFQIHWEC